jgi:DNA-3-methyladenine glycosylase
MQRHRGTKTLQDLTRGPGRLAAALQITRRHDGLDLCAADATLWLGALAQAPDQSGTSAAGRPTVARTVRIGISRAADRLLRFYERGNPFVSGPKRLLSQVKKSAKNRSAKTRKPRPPAPRSRFRK